MKLTYEQCIDKALWLINNGYSDEQYSVLVEKLWSINNKNEEEKNANSNPPLNNNN